MTSGEYLKRLKDSLSALPFEEREEAVNYYKEFLEEAGEENIASVIAELGSPEKLAESILAGQNPEAAAWTEKSAEIPPVVLPEEHGNSSGEKTSPKKDNDNLVTVLVILALVLTFPVWGGAVLGLIFGGLGILLALAVVVAAMILGGAALLIWSIVSMAAGGGLSVIGWAGAGLILLALGLGLSVPTVWLYGKGLPALFRGCKKLFYRLTNRSEKDC